MKRKSILPLLLILALATGCGAVDSGDEVGLGDEAYFSTEADTSDDVGQEDSVTDSGDETITEDSSEGYKQAYIETAKSIKEGYDSDDLVFGLIDFDGDDTPELLANVGGAYSLYTYEDGAIRCLMDMWPFGAGGNLGYQYAPGKGIVRNDGTPYYGAFYYSTFLSKHEEGELESDYTVTEYHFDDVDGDGYPSEEELEGASEMKVFKMEYTCNNDENLSEDQIKEKIEIYDSYTYEDFNATLSCDELIKELS